MSWGAGPDDEFKNTVRELLATNKALFLSTSANERPWVAGVYFAESDAFHLTLILETDGRSLANIRVNPQIAVTVSTGSAFDLYLRGERDEEGIAGDDKFDAAKKPCRRNA